MVALYQSGRQGEALRASHTYRAHLADELGLDPSEAITQLEQRIAMDDATLRPTAPPLVPTGAVPGLSVRGYELRERIGSGATGDVFSAFQPAVGREVAIKVVRPEMANDPDFIRRFEAEARVVAGLEHPRIVPVYDYWREAGGAFLVMRRFDGGNLRTVLDDGAPLTVATRRTIVEQVASALAAAHDRGITHGDLRPANVLIDQTGDAYLADFGLSDGVASPDHSSRGFMAPEQISTGQPSLAADVFALGALADRLLGADEPAICTVVERARHVEPADRFSDARAFLTAYDAAIGRPAAESSADGVTNPYRGLEAFHETDASVFFGRERLIDRLLARIGSTGSTGRFVALVGPSGSGKSSLVRAGVVPALRRGAVPGSDRWFIATLVPGPNPFASLADALRSIAVDPPDDLTERLRSLGIAPVVKDLLADAGAQAVLVVDQLEELFIQSDPDEAREFLDAIATAVTNRHAVVRFIATLRADFYDAPLRHARFGELMRLGTDAITPLAPGELERAITGPAAHARVVVEPGVVAAIASDMVGQPTALPLMQFALTEVFDRRCGPTITVGDYHDLGGLTAALAGRADAVLHDLTPSQRADARHLFLRLVTLSDGAADTRRRARLSELAHSVRGDPSPVVDAFVEHRLLSIDRDPITRGPTVEIAHEALLTEWTTLRHWIDDARGDVRLQRRLAMAAAEWRAGDQHVDYLFSGGQLAAYACWQSHTPFRLSADEDSFLLASRSHSQEEVDVERLRSRRLRRLVVGVGVALVAALVASGLAYLQSRRADLEAQRATEAAARADELRTIAESQTIAVQEQREIAQTRSAEASEQADIAESQTIAATASALTADLERMRAQATAEIGTNPPLAALLAVEAYNIDASPLSAGAIQRVLTGIDGRQATLFDTKADYGGRNVISADRSVVAASSGSAVDVWDIDTRSLLRRVEGQFAEFDLSGDASLLAVEGAGSPTLDIVSVESGAVLGTINRVTCFVVRFSPSGNRLALLTQRDNESFGCNEQTPPTLEIWDISDPSAPTPEQVDADAGAFEFWWTPDGSGYITAGLDGSVQLQDSTTHEVRWTHQFDLTAGVTQGTLARPIGSLFRSDGNDVVIGVQFNDTSGILLFTFDVATGAILREPTSTAGLGSMNWWNEEETEIVGTLWPSGATVLDLERATEVLPPPITNPNATAVWIDRDHDRVVVTSFVGIEIFSPDGHSVLERRVSLTPEQLAIKAESDGQLFGSMTADGNRLRLTALDFTGRMPVIEWDLTTDPPTWIADHPSALTFAQGESTLLLDFDGVAVLDGDHEPLGPVISTEPERGQPYIWRASANGARHAPLRAGSTVIDIYDTASGKRVEVTMPGAAPGAEGFITSEYSFSADGRYLVATFIGPDGEIWAVFDTSTGAVVHSDRSDTMNQPWLSGDTIYSNPANGFDVERRNIETLEIVGPPLVGHTLILNDILDDLDSDRIITQATNGNVRVWDRATGDQIGREIAIGRQSSGTGVAAARDGDLVGILLDTEFAIWNYDLDSWPELACDIAGRNMTPSEWDDFGPQGAEYRATCPQFPSGA